MIPLNDVPEIHKLSLSPTDIIVVKFKNIVPKSVMEQVKSEYVSIFPNHKILVMSYLVDMDIITTDSLP